jgi:hypothetical protein
MRDFVSQLHDGQMGGGGGKLQKRYVLCLGRS